jgi:hypothetical protein
MQTLIQPILGLDNEFPESVFVLHHVTSRRYGCYCHQNVHGLACFSTESGAANFGQFIDLDEARDVAKDRPMPVTAVMLLDNMNDPKIHFIR